MHELYDLKGKMKYQGDDGVWRSSSRYERG